MITREHQVKACAQFFGETNSVPLIHFTLQFNNCSSGLNAIEVNYIERIWSLQISIRKALLTSGTTTQSMLVVVVRFLKDIAELDTGFSIKNFKFFIRPDLLGALQVLFCHLISRIPFHPRKIQKRVVLFWSAILIFIVMYVYVL